MANVSFSKTLALSTALVLSVSSQGWAQAEPKAVVPEPVFDAGTVVKGKVVSHTFEIENKGAAPLEIREVRPACGCTVAKYDATITPGGTGKITAEVSTEDFRGPVAKYVTVFTNDRETPRFRLTIRADIRPTIDILPGYGRYLHVQGTDPKVQTQTLWSTDGTKLEVVSSRSSLPFLAVEHHLATPEERVAEGPDRQWVVTGTLASDAPEGALTGTITIETNHPDFKTLEVPLGGYVRPQVLTTPAKLDFGTFPAHQPRKASVLVTNYAMGPLAITSVETDIEGLEATVEEQLEGRKFAIHLNLESKANPGPIKGNLTIHTDNPRQPVTSVPIQGVLQ
ncbi:MAG: DUF1573 domain-containing protein [Thermoanaerobaculia bacterium]|nr:DUF1573 domain-containing protein [Thermoanaerobaculia bacterium]